ncbi:uncharacterized protein Dana_GF27571 [Drosophila ananassae]|uniref:Uncharacterized protein n=1 Tax=Drosophila ananassae TaxID=7217 RepID=A0A0P9C143_DROAN|nr:uncharacterized protein LOC26514980 [Drosophila ananassae]KPU77337.1 uncharacterized protein Dana_GF27571 [Drosophila ananassae]
MNVLPPFSLDKPNSVPALLSFSEKDKNSSESVNNKICDDPEQIIESSSIYKMYALSDHNYTIKNQKLLQNSLDTIRSMLLNAVLPNRIMVKHIPIEIHNFIENTINNLIFYKMEYLHIKSEKLSERDTSTIQTSDLDTENFLEPLKLEIMNQYDINFKPKNRLLPILHDTMNFAKQLFYDSKNFLTNSDEEFKEFISNKLKMLKEISDSLQIYKTRMENSEMTNLSLMSRNRTNYKAKLKLLLDSSDSSRTDFDIKSSCNEINIETSSEKILNSQFLSSNDFMQYKTLYKNFSDGIDLFKYIKLDVQLKPTVLISEKLRTNERKKSTDIEADRDIERNA